MQEPWLGAAVAICFLQPLNAKGWRFWQGLICWGLAGAAPEVKVAAAAGWRSCPENVAPCSPWICSAAGTREPLPVPGALWHWGWDSRGMVGSLP